LQDVDGVYLVGGGTHPGSGLPVIFEGARITSDLVVSDLKIDSKKIVAGNSYENITDMAAE
jgi:phytoene desaturase